MATAEARWVRCPRSRASTNAHNLINDLEHELKGFRQYDNAHRVRTSLHGDTPSEVTGEITSRRAEFNSTTSSGILIAAGDTSYPQALE